MCTRDNANPGRPYERCCEDGSRGGRNTLRSNQSWAAARRNCEHFQKW